MQMRGIGARRLSLGRLSYPARAAANVVGVLIALGALWVGYRMISTSPQGAIDFRTGIWQPAQDILNGNSPYPDAATWRNEDGMPSIYPPLIALLATPFGLLSFGLASMLWAALLIVALLLTLWFLGVRDWRLYGVVFFLSPVIDALGLGQVEFLLLLAIAVLWRYRDRWRIAALALGCGLAVKPLMFPLILWLLFTRRFRAALASIPIALGLAIASWAVIGFAGFGSYPALLQAWDRAYGACGISVGALALKLGAPGVLATSLRLAVAGALLAYAWRVVPRTDGDRRAFSAAIGALVIASPVVWSHYLVYFIAPLALAAPRLERRWLLLALPLLFSQETSLSMHLVHTGDRLVPTASNVGSDSYLVLGEYLLLTAALVLVTLRERLPLPLRGLRGRSRSHRLGELQTDS